jgi:hypothetical protein
VVKRTLTVTILLLGIATPAAPKVLCPPGRYTLHTSGDTRAAAFDGLELVLGEGDATLAGTCAAVPARPFHRSSGSWLYRVRARWKRCQGRRLALHARFDLERLYCTRLEGALRLGRSRRVRFVADRIPECGNELRERGEQCDDGTESPCCGLDCRVKPGCAVWCDRDFPCEAGQLCVHVCRFSGVCSPRNEIDCGGPVCGCDEQTTYADRCAAYEAGTGPAYLGPCRR